MKLYSAFLIIFLSCVFTLAKAQYGRGCLVAGVLYTSNTSQGNRYFYSTTGKVNSNCGFTRLAGSGDCRLYNSGPLNKNSSYTQYSGAYGTSWNKIINCPIDDYVWPLLISISALVAFRLKSKFLAG